MSKTQHLCKLVPSTLCNLPDYCRRNGCANLPPDKTKKEKSRD